MKLIYASISVLVAVIMTGCATTTPAPQSATKHEQVTYAVYGMDCPGCHGGIEKNLEKLPGIIDASANWKDKRVTLALAPGQKADKAAIEQMVEDSNFTLGERI